MRDDDPTHTIEGVKCLRTTDKALLCDIPDAGEVWIPVSHVHPDSEVYDAGDNAEGKLVISEWIAKQKELI